MEDLKVEIIDLLCSTNRPGVKDLIERMTENGYFTSPASTKYHGSFEGGLAKHSYALYTYFRAQVKELGLVVPEESIILTSFLHDLCKVGAYIETTNGYKWNRNQPKGHASLSLIRSLKFLELNLLEQDLIKYHMGFYGLKEYTFAQIMSAWKDSRIKLFYFCDELASISGN